MFSIATSKEKSSIILYYYDGENSFVLCPEKPKEIIFKEFGYIESVVYDGKSTLQWDSFFLTFMTISVGGATSFKVATTPKLMESLNNALNRWNLYVKQFVKSY